MSQIYETSREDLERWSMSDDGDWTPAGQATLAAAAVMAERIERLVEQLELINETLGTITYHMGER